MSAKVFKGLQRPCSTVKLKSGCHSDSSDIPYFRLWNRRKVGNKHLEALQKIYIDKGIDGIFQLFFSSFGTEFSKNTTSLKTMKWSSKMG